MTSQGVSLVLRHVDDGCDVGELEDFVFLLAAAEGLFDGVSEVNVDGTVQHEVHREVDHVRYVEHILKTEEKTTLFISRINSNLIWSLESKISSLLLN